VLQPNFQPTSTTKRAIAQNIDDKVAALSKHFAQENASVKSVFSNRLEALSKQVGNQIAGNKKDTLQALDQFETSYRNDQQELSLVMWKYKEATEWRIKESLMQSEERLMAYSSMNSLSLIDLKASMEAAQIRAVETNQQLSNIEAFLGEEMLRRKLRQPSWILRRLFYRTILTLIGILCFFTGWMKKGWRYWLLNLQDLIRQRKYPEFRFALRHPRTSYLAVRLANSEDITEVDNPLLDTLEDSNKGEAVDAAGSMALLASENGQFDDVNEGHDQPDLAQHEVATTDVANSETLGEPAAHSIGYEHVTTHAELPATAPITIDADTQILTADGMVNEHHLVSWNEVKPNTPTLSVIIPCYNYGRYLEDCVASVVNQTLANVEIIIVDNGSTDPLTVTVVERYEQDPSVKVIRLNPNIGLPAARNVGIEAAKAKFVCCIDADDMFELTYLEKALAFLQTDTSLGFVYPWARVFGEEQLVWQTLDFDPLLAREDNRSTVCGVYRKADWELCGRFNPEMHGGYDDWEFWIRLSMLGRRGLAIQEPLFLHRKHSSNMTNSAKLSREAWLEKMRGLAPSFYYDNALTARLSNLKGIDRLTPDFSLVVADIEPGQDEKPHMLVFAPWLPRGGGAEALLFQQLAHFKAKWRISIVTTVPADNDMTAEFYGVTHEIYHLPAFLPQSAWCDFIIHLMSVRKTTIAFSSGSQFYYHHVSSIKAAAPDVIYADLLHNDLPNGHISAAIEASQSFDVHFVISRKIERSLLEAGVPEHRIKVVENGVDADINFHPDTVVRDEAKANLGLESAKFVLAFVGRFSDEKRPLEFLEILNDLQDVEAIGAILVGGGTMAPLVDARLEHGIHVPVKRFDGLSHDKLAEVYAAADMLVMTSTIEGQPFVLLEALAMGCPAACTAVGDIPRIVTEGQNGFLTDRDNPRGLVDKLRTYIEQPKLHKKFRKAARQSIITEQLTRSSMLAGYDRALDALLTAKAVAAPQGELTEATFG
jgi:glycosyltransferase involved in cell wall biosynthesis